MWSYFFTTKYLDVLLKSSLSSGTDMSQKSYYVSVVLLEVLPRVWGSSRWALLSLSGLVNDSYFIRIYSDILAKLVVKGHFLLSHSFIFSAPGFLLHPRSAPTPFCFLLHKATSKFMLLSLPNKATNVRSQIYFLH